MAALGLQVRVERVMQKDVGKLGADVGIRKAVALIVPEGPLGAATAAIIKSGLTQAGLTVRELEVPEGVGEYILVVTD